MMKASTKLILLTVLVIVGSLLFYNFKLKSVYQDKSYKNRFRDMNYTVLHGINALDLQSANRIGIQVEYGTKEGLWVAKRLKDNIKISKSGATLELDFVKNAKSNGPSRSGIFLILITKDLQRLTATHTATKPDAAFSSSQVRLKGFQLSKLDIQVAADTQFYFDGMQVDTLNAVIGGDDYVGKAELTLPFNTTINAASFNIGINGNVSLQGAKVIKTSSSMAKEAAIK
jgi:hypothetical protein